MADTKAAAPVDEDVEKPEDENSQGEGMGEDEDFDPKTEYVKKVYVARPYESTSGVFEEVNNAIVKQSRPTI